MRTPAAIALFVAVAAVLISAVGELLSRRAPPAAALRTEAQTPPSAEFAAEGDRREPVNADPVDLSSLEEPQLAPKIDLQRGKLAWEEKIEAVLGDAALTDAAKARQLFAMLPALPETALTTAAEDAVQRVPDGDYAQIALPLLANPQTNGQVAGVLFADLMERPESIALPALLRLAKMPNNSYAPFALDNLNLLLGEEHGRDWLQWDAAIRRKLATGLP